MATFEDFQKLDVRVGKIVAAAILGGAINIWNKMRNPPYPWTETLNQYKKLSDTARTADNVLIRRMPRKYFIPEP